MVIASIQHIVLSEGMRGGRPCLVGTRITVADVVIMYLHLGLSLEEIAGKYELEIASLHAAMTYYYDHRTEIDASIAEDEAVAKAFEEKNPSLLQAKLKAFQHV